MGYTDIIQPSSISTYAFNKAFDHPLVKIIHTADLLALTIEPVIDYKLQVK